MENVPIRLTSKYFKKYDNIFEIISKLPIFKWHYQTLQRKGRRCEELVILMKLIEYKYILYLQSVNIHAMANIYQ